MIFDKKTYESRDVSAFPIWCQPWYLKAICADRWNVRYIFEEEEVKAVWVYGERVVLGIRSINFPTFLKYNGLFFPADQVDVDKMKLLLDSLPSRVKMTTSFQLGLHERIPELSAWFKDRAFAQKLRHTYVWDVGRGKEELLRGMEGNYRRMINKHIDSCDFSMVSLEKAAELYGFHREWVGDLANHGIKEEQFKNTLKALYEHKAGGVFELIKDGVKIASAMVSFDKGKGFYLLAVNNKEYNKIYPGVLMAYQLACYAFDHGIKELDFLGSDIESIARVWRKLGAEQDQYLYVSKSAIKSKS